MDGDYDEAAAAEALELVAYTRATNPHAGVQLSNLCKNENWEASYSVVHTGSPGTWRLVHAETGEGGTSTSNEIEEVVASIQGIVCRRNELPPFMDKISSNSKGVRFIRQGVSIIGFGTPSFESATNNLMQVYAMFSRNIAQDKLQPCTTIPQYRNQASIESSNRYFTPRKDATQMQEVSFCRDVDPLGTLAKLCGQDFFHGEDNVVCYYERLLGKNGEARFVPMDPIKIRVGDIVEIQSSFVVIPVRGGEYKMVSLLRSVTLIDKSHTQNAIMARARNQSKSDPPKIFKRKVGYAEEEVAEARAKMSRMDLDESTTRN